MTRDNGSGLLVVGMDVPAEHEDELNRWYDEQHLRDRLAIPGFISARRYVAVEGSPKYLTIYEMENPEVVKSDAYRNHSQNDWDRRMHQIYELKLRSIYRDITKPVGV